MNTNIQKLCFGKYAPTLLTPQNFNNRVRFHIVHIVTYTIGKYTPAVITFHNLSNGE